MLSDFLKPNHVIFDLHVNNKKHLFQELSFKSYLIDKNIDDKKALGDVTAYICAGFTCEKPISDINEFSNRVNLL